MKVAVNQAWAARVPAMEVAIRSFERPVNALEIGTWMGVGSTQIWLDNLKPGSTLTLMDAWKAYASAADLADAQWNYAAMDQDMHSAYLATIGAVWRYEHGNSAAIEVNILRGDSVKLCAMMKDQSFDFIYIDGDHKYESVRQNVRDARRLIRPGGMICGDDLERLPTPELLRIAVQHTERDYLREPHNFHPGVMLALAVELDDFAGASVQMENGFWWWQA